MATIEALKNLMRRVPGRAWLAAGGLLAAALWMQQHDARIRQQVGLQQLRNETSAQVAALRRQAAEDVQQANAQNAQAVAKLEQRRREAERQNGQLAAQLESLRKQAQIQAGEVATLPISEIVTRVAAQLGLKAEDLSAKDSRKGAKAQRELQVTNDELPNIGRFADIAKAATSAPAKTQPADMAKSATSAPPGAAQSADIAEGAISAPPELGQAVPADMAKSATSAPAGELPEGGSSADIAKGATSARPELGQAVPADIAKSAISAPAAGGQSPPLQNPVALALTASGARKVEASLVALDACRAESDIQARQLANCQARAEADEAAIERLKGSVASLNQALAAKDKILSEQQSQYKAELRAARGTFLGRLARLSEHVAIGVAVGVAIGAAAR